MASTADRIVRQVEYYFCDTSFPFDAFLTGLAKEEGKDGFVDPIFVDAGNRLGERGARIAAAAAAVRADAGGEEMARAASEPT